MSKIVVVDRPEYSRVELDTFDPVILAKETQQIIPAGTVLGKITASGKYTPLSATAEDGSEDPAAILLNQVIVPANEDLAHGAICVFRHARLLRSQLIWPASYGADDIKSALEVLEASGIVTSTK